MPGDAEAGMAESRDPGSARGGDAGPARLNTDVTAAALAEGRWGRREASAISYMSWSVGHRYKLDRQRVARSRTDCIRRRLRHGALDAHARLRTYRDRRRRRNAAAASAGDDSRTYFGKLRGYLPSIDEATLARMIVPAELGGDAGPFETLAPAELALDGRAGFDRDMSKSAAVRSLRRFSVSGRHSS